MLSFKDSALLTLSFFHSLEFAPTKGELLSSLFFHHSERSEEFSQLSHFIVERDGYITFKGSESLIDLRKEKIVIAEKYWRKVHRWRWLFRLTPFLRCVSICNNLSSGNVTEKSDIDLFVITKKNRLFLVRTWMTLLFHLFGLRRHYQKIASRFCLSFFVSEDDLNFETLQIKPKQDLYLAFWMISLKPIYGEKFLQVFYEENAHWLKEYYPLFNLGETTFPPRAHHSPDVTSGSGFAPLPSFRFGRGPRDPAFANLFLGETTFPPRTRSRQRAFLDSLEAFLAKWQLRRAEEKRGRLPSPDGTILKKTLLKFHDEDRKREFAEKAFRRFATIQQSDLIRF